MATVGAGARRAAEAAGSGCFDCLGGSGKLCRRGSNVRLLAVAKIVDPVGCWC